MSSSSIKCLTQTSLITPDLSDLGDSLGIRNFGSIKQSNGWKTRSLINLFSGMLKLSSSLLNLTYVSDPCCTEEILREHGAARVCFHHLL